MFHLVNSTGSIYLLDDDPIFLRNLKSSLGLKNVPIRTFESPKLCLTELVSNICVWVTTLEMQREIIERWRGGHDDQQLMNDVLSFWGRGLLYTRCSLVVLDYSMPGLNGLDVLRQVTSLPANRILLTGQADDTLAVQAFNEGLIKQFVPKTQAAMSRLRETVDRLRMDALSVDAELWRGCLNNSQTEVLQKHSTELSRLVLDRAWVELVTLPKPFGILGRTRDGRTEFLSLEPSIPIPGAMARPVKVDTGLPSSKAALVEIDTSSVTSQYTMTLSRFLSTSSDQPPVQLH